MNQIKESNRRTRRPRNVDSPPPTHVSFRVTPDQYVMLVEQAVDHENVSALVKARVLGKGLRDTTVLRQIAALNQAGRALLDLNGRDNSSKLETAALIERVRDAIERLARQLP